MKNMLLFAVVFPIATIMPMELQIEIHNKTNRQWNIYSWANNFKDQSRKELEQKTELLRLQLAKKDLDRTQALVAALTIIDPESKSKPILAGFSKEKVSPLVTLWVHLCDKTDSCEQTLQAYVEQKNSMISGTSPIDLMAGTHNLTAYLYLRGNNLEDSQLILASEKAD